MMNDVGSSYVVEDVTIPIVEFSVGKIKDKTKADFKMYKSTDPGTKNRRKLVCETSTMEYIGNNYANDPSRNYLNQYLIVRDKATGKKTILQAERFKMYPIVKRDDDVDSDTERMEAIRKAENDSRTFEQKLDNLTEVFGSKGKRKAMASRLRNKTSDVAESVAKHVQQLVETEGISGGNVDEICLSILPYDKEATSEEQIYPLDKYIPTSIQLSVTQAAQELLNVTDSEIEKWKTEYNPLACRFISWRAKNMHPSTASDEVTKTSYLNCLQLLAYFMKFHTPKFQTPSSGRLDKGKYLLAIDESWKEWFRRTFTPDKNVISLQSRLPAQVKDRILAYAVVLAWHIDSHEFDLQTLAEGFSISEKKLSTVVRALGGRIQNRQHDGIKRSVAVLKLPLVFPKAKTQRR